MARFLRIVIATLAVVGASGSAPAGPLLWQTSSEGDDIHVFNLTSGQLMQRLVVGPEPKRNLVIDLDPARTGAPSGRARY